MKKIFAMLLALAMMLALAACGSQNTGNDTPDGGDEPAGTPAVKVGLLLEGSLGDESINDQAYEGLKKVAADFREETK